MLLIHIIPEATATCVHSGVLDTNEQGSDNMRGVMGSLLFTCAKSLSSELSTA